MKSNTRVVGVFFAVFLLFVSIYSSFAQQGSIYFSVGDNTSWYKNSTIHIDQSEIGNSYDLNKAKGTNKTNTPVGPLHLNYRLGFYCNEVQDIGIELDFDPVNYTIKDGTTVSMSGMYNGQFNVKTSATFSRKGGSYYYMDGLNLFLINFVKRWGIYRANSSKVSVDILGKGGIGPVLPTLHTKLPVNPLDDAQLSWGGWNYGIEAALRVTLYRYGYLEFGGKYDHAMMDGMQIYQGTASQNLNTYELIASVGFTFPTTHLNPLFFKPKNIITILPWYQHKDELGEAPPADINGGEKKNTDSAGGPEIPEFGDITGKSEAKFNLDSLAAIDSAANAKADSAAAADHTSKKKKRRHKSDVTDSLAAPVTDSAALPVKDALKAAVDSANAAPVAPAEAPKSRKKKRRHKTEAADTSAAPAPLADPATPPAAPPAPVPDTSSAPAPETPKKPE